MTAPPLPASPCLRIKLDYNQGATGAQGSRFYLSYSGSAPTGANCVTLAGDVAAAWASHLAPVVSGDFGLTEVDVLDIATDSGLSGQWTGENAGSGTLPCAPLNVAVNVEFGISRRYRGGKPRMFMPSPPMSELGGISTLSTAYVAAVNTAVAAFMSEIEGLSVGAVGTLAHVNLSYYKGFTNIENSSGRERAVPTYRDSALVEPITGYFCKVVVGSQRRRRTSTTP